MRRVKTDTILIGMNTGICPAASLDVRPFPDDFIQGFLEFLLYGGGIILHLPAMKRPPVIHDCH